MIWIAVGVALAGLAAWGPIASDVEQAKYEVVEAADGFEIRTYAPHIVAETTVEGERKQAINEGFRKIADYIFGNNSASAKVAMTAPVTQEAVGQKIAMTAPVTQQEAGGTWKVQFVMPAEYTMKTLPKPTTREVTLRQIPAKTYAAITFSGTANEADLAARAAELEMFIKEKKLRRIGTPTFAFYNPPWTLPFLRRNEVLVEVKG